MSREAWDAFWRKTHQEFEGDEGVDGTDVLRDTFKVESPVRALSRLHVCHGLRT